MIRRFKTVNEYREATGQEQHSVLVNYEIFMKVGKPHRTDPRGLYDPRGFNFELRPGSAAVDAGIVLPNINDGHAGPGIFDDDANPRRGIRRDAANRKTLGGGLPRLHIFVQPAAHRVEVPKPLAIGDVPLAARHVLSCWALTKATIPRVSRIWNNGIQ